LWVEGRDFELVPDGGGALVYQSWQSRQSLRGLQNGFSVPGITLGLRGNHQRLNAAVACACLDLLDAQGLKVSPESLRAGLAGVQWEGRLEEVARDPTVLVDGAHNPAAAAALVQALDALYPGRSVRLVFGILGDKERGPILRALVPRAARVYLARPHNVRGLDPKHYEDEVRKLCPEVQLYGSIPEALAAARTEQSSSPSEKLILATGSLTVVGEVKGALTGRNR